MPEVCYNVPMPEPAASHTTPQSTSDSVDDEVLTPREAAAMMRIPVGTLYGWRHRGKGPKSIKAGRYVRYRRSAVNAWLDEREGYHNGADPSMGTQ